MKALSGVWVFVSTTIAVYSYQQGDWAWAIVSAAVAVLCLITFYLSMGDR